MTPPVKQTRLQMNIDPFMKSKDFTEQQHQNVGRLQEPQQSIQNQKYDIVVPRALGNSRDREKGSLHSNQSSSLPSPSPSTFIANPTNIDRKQNSPIYLSLDDSACTSKGVCSVENKQHIDVHFDHKCTFCGYTSRTEGHLNRHIIDCHPESWAGKKKLVDSKRSKPSGRGSTSGNKKPKKCKLCSFTSDNKPDFYQHLEKEHISKDKILKCPDCRFVTEYKYHFEYHVRNHYGSKPFKCSKCNYSCVNKSMLSSHEKSHSKLYPYRCGECIYATKYSHTLKVHCRKSGHEPGQTLNPDDTPNPNPVIDVYGKRRGPRGKVRNKSKPKALSSKHTADSIPDSDNSEAEDAISNQPFLSPSPYISENSFPPYIQKSKSTSPTGNYITHQQSQDYLPGDCSKKADRNDTPVTPILKKETIDSLPDTITDQSDIFTCEFCDTMYEGFSMYIMHMAYHGYENPFTCNKCGETTKDKVEFFLHLIRVTHL